MAFVAAAILALGLHPPHATASSGPSDHSHFGATCLQAELQESGSEKLSGDVPAGHADCSQMYDPLVRKPVDWLFAFTTVVTPTPRAEPYRQLVLPFDPPPPRWRG